MRARKLRINCEEDLFEVAGHKSLLAVRDRRRAFGFDEEEDYKIGIIQEESEHAIDGSLLGESVLKNAFKKKRENMDIESDTTSDKENDIHH